MTKTWPTYFLTITKRFLIVKPSIWNSTQLLNSMGRIMSLIFQPYVVFFFLKKPIHSRPFNNFFWYITPLIRKHNIKYTSYSTTDGHSHHPTKQFTILSYHHKLVACSACIGCQFKQQKSSVLDSEDTKRNTYCSCCWKVLNKQKQSSVIILTSSTTVF